MSDTQFFRGEAVRVRMTPDVFGQVIGEMDWGQKYLVRIADSAESVWYNDVELETYPVDKQPSGSTGDDGGVEDLEIDNVVDLAAARAAGRA